MGVALSATALTASAQKAYKEGVAVMQMSMMGQNIEAKSYFTTDSTAVAFNAGPADVKVLTNNKGSYMAYLVDISVMGRKVAAVASPAEAEEELSKLPKLTFTPGTETKVINGFNCKKVVAKDKDGKTFDIWVTNDISLPKSAASRTYEGAGGVPIQYTTFQNGQASEITVKSVTEQKLPAGTFGIPKDYDRITMDEFNAMRNGGGR